MCDQRQGVTREHRILMATRSVSRIRTELLAIRAQLDHALESLDKESDEPDTSERLVMSAEEYAAHQRCSTETIRRYAKVGLPHSRLGGGRLRISVKDADEWIRAGGAKRAAERDGAQHARKAG